MKILFKWLVIIFTVILLITLLKSHYSEKDKTIDEPLIIAYHQSSNI